MGKKSIAREYEHKPVMREDTASGSACSVLATDAIDALTSRTWCSSRDGRDRSMGGSTSSSAAGSFQHRGEHMNTRAKVQKFFHLEISFHKLHNEGIG